MMGGAPEPATDHERETELVRLAASLAEEAGLSVSAFLRFFHAMFGLRPSTLFSGRTMISAVGRLENEPSRFSA